MMGKSNDGPSATHLLCEDHFEGIGGKIINSIIEGSLFRIECGPDDSMMIVWSANAAEQLSALVVEKVQKMQGASHADPN